MTSRELRKKYLDFFESKGHTVIPSALLVPESTESDSTLFTTAGMQPLIPYLMGEEHKGGKRITNVQKCIRTDDIDEVGDSYHHTFFEMMGNWSLGDYFKKEAIEWSFEFLTDKKWLGIDMKNLAVSVFAGDKDAPFDQESFDIWKGFGFSEGRIAKLPKKNNWWGPAGATGPCGPDTEMFYWTGEGEAPAVFDTDDVRWVEIWNDVFMQYFKNDKGEFETLSQQNVDTGMGLERTLAVLVGTDDNYETELFRPIIEKIEEISGKKYKFEKGDLGFDVMPECWLKDMQAMRIVADHIKASIFAISDGVTPSNKDRGYIVRRLLRRAIIKAHQLGIKENFVTQIAEKVFDIYEGVYDFRKEVALKECMAEEEKFRKTLALGLKIFEKRIIGGFGSTVLGGALPKDIGEKNRGAKKVTGKELFDLYQTYGFPLELSLELAAEKNIKADESGYHVQYKLHQEQSRTASAGMFKGGLADSSEETTRLHTTAHLLHAALRQVLGTQVVQKGSNITTERLRFDFSQDDKMTSDQINKVEDMVNEEIEKKLPVTKEEMTVEEAKKSGALGVFEHKYGDKVSVYTVGPADKYFSREICGGPHVTNTSELGHFKIIKEESSSKGVRRIKATLE